MVENEIENVNVYNTMGIGMIQKYLKMCKLNADNKPLKMYNSLIILLK